MTIPSSSSNNLSIFEWSAGVLIAGIGAALSYLSTRVGKIDGRMDEMEEKVNKVAGDAGASASLGDDKIWEALGRLQEDVHRHQVHVAGTMLSRDEFYRANAENRADRDAMKQDILAAIREARRDGAGARP